MYDAMNGPFCMVAAAWSSWLERAAQRKNQRFGPEAAEGLRFYCGPYDFLFKAMGSDRFFRIPTTHGSPDIVVTTNKVAEFVEIFGPNMYQKNPTRRVTTRKIPDIDPNLFMQDPQMAQMVQQVYQMSVMEQMKDKSTAALFDALLNVTPDLCNLKQESRDAIDESLITGLGLLITEARTNPATGRKVVGNYKHSVSDFLMDPDAKKIDGCRAVAFRKKMHRWEVERQFRLPPGILIGNYDSPSRLPGDNDQRLVSGSDPNDIIEVWEIYSKMGCGGRLMGCQGASVENRAVYELMGDYCYVAIVRGHPWPLNLPPWMFDKRNPNAWHQAKQAIAWPTPFWIDPRSQWPHTNFYYHTVTDEVWPMSHLTPAMGELKFLNWGMAMIASKIGVTSRDLIFCKDDIANEVENAIKNGTDLTVVKVPGLGNKTIKDFVEMFQHPEWNPDIWKVIQAVSQAFDDRVGLNELMYGQSQRQLRSAEEANQKYEAVNVRPQDMADKVEDAMSAAAQREMWCSAYNLLPADVQTLCGIAAGFAWSVLVAPDILKVLDLQAHIESDSSKKPNKMALSDALNQSMQTLIQPLFVAAQAGMPQPFNALVGDFLDSLGVPGRERYQLQLPPPMPEQPPADPEADKQRQHEKEMQDSKHEHEEKIASKKAKAA